MSKTVLAQVDGFTPLIDGVVADVGVVTAAVFGKAWRYCQMADGVCKAAQERIADELGLSRATVNAHLKKLCETGYLRDTTPNLAGLPHVYADTGRANLSISFTGTTATCQKDLHPPVNEIDTKKEVKKEEKEESKFTEEEQSHNLRELATLYQKNIGVIVPLLSEKLQEASTLYPAHLYEPAFAAAVAKNARNWAFVEACIKNANDGKEYIPKRTPYIPRHPKAAAPIPVTIDERGMVESY